MLMDFIFGDIFNYIGYLFGYVIWFFFELTKDYGISIILFAVLLNLLFLPLAIKRQKTMLDKSRMAEKQKEIQKKYGNDKRKLNEEMSKLYAEEGNPMSGCLTMMIQPLLLMGVVTCIYKPLQNILHISTSKISEAMSFLQTIPGIGVTFGNNYGEIEVIKLFPFVQDKLTMFSSQELSNMFEFNKGFNFLGIDLLATPQYSSWQTGLWLIPVLSFLSYALSMYITQKMQPMQNTNNGCMKYSFYIMPIFFAWIAYTVPAGVGFYWIVSSIIGIGQNVVLNKFYGVGILNAKREAARIALRREQEKDMKPIR